jgi:cytochrome b561
MPTPCSPEAVRYDSRTISLHWITAALVVLLWGVAHLIDDFPRGLPRISVRSIHIVLGVILLLVVGMRLLWRLTRGERLAPARAGIGGWLSRGVHASLYVLVLATVGLGVAHTWIRGDSIFGLFKIVSLAPGNTNLKEFVEYLHATAANALVILASLHALAGLLHHFVLHDGVLKRMWPQKVMTARQE